METIKIQKLNDSVKSFNNSTRDITHKFIISSNKYGRICTYLLKYFISDEMHIYHMNSDVIMHSGECYEIAESASFYDLDNDDIFINVRINLYKKPHKGWNNRLLNNIFIHVYNDRRVEYGCM